MNLFEKLNKWSFSYWAVKELLIAHLFDAYFQKVKEVHKDKIPKNAPTLIASNHQNALMDPMAFAVHLPGQNFFLTRADVFNKPTIEKFLHWGKMLPVYRIRDGVESLKKNENIFGTCVELLHSNRRVVLFPEGNHGEKRRLRPLVKGVFRIAFQAQEKYGNKEGIKILPVGVDYKHFQKFRQTLLIIYGDPIDVSEYWDTFKSNPAEATNLLKDRLADEIKKLIIHIETDEYYDLFMELRDIYNPKMREKLGIKENSLYSRYKADKAMIAQLDQVLLSEPEKIKTLNDNYSILKKGRDKLNLRNWVFKKKRYAVSINLLNLFLSIAVSPMFLLGLATNWPHFFLPPKMAKKIKDPQFVSTMKWASGSGFLIVYYLILLVLALAFLPVWWAKISFILLMPISGLLALSIRKIFVKSLARIRYTFSNDKDMILAKKAYDSIISAMDKIIK